MIKIKKATKAHTETLALLARTTWAESHGQYIDDKNDLLTYLNKNFSTSRIEQGINNPKLLFYIVYVNDLPVGYAKLIVNATNKYVKSQYNCQLERIFILNDFIPLKLGKQLIDFVEEKAKSLQLDAMWLTVYIKNNRAIRFYEKNEFIHVGNVNFVVSGKAYDNIVFSKRL
ncbi:MAG: GNAT family N-acetyltransferase [Winogradskyella sp.]|nr:MAG: GNAT family N-acetyltransferase [Winogradskyella sp.]